MAGSAHNYEYTAHRKRTCADFCWDGFNLAEYVAQPCRGAAPPLCERMCSDRIHEIAPNRMPAHWPVSGPRSAAAFCVMGRLSLRTDLFPQFGADTLSLRSTRPRSSASSPPWLRPSPWRAASNSHAGAARGPVPASVSVSSWFRPRWRLRTGLVRKKWGLRSG